MTTNVLKNIDYSDNDPLINTLKLIEDIDPVTEDDFPIEALPAKAQTIINQLQRALKYPPSYTAISMLWAVSVGNGNTHRVRVKNGYTESSVLYAAMVGRAGACKTPPLNFIKGPLEKRDSEILKAYAEEKKRYDEIQGLPKDERERLGYSGLQKPCFAKSIYSDFTLEALLKGHESNKKSIAIASDELMTFFGNQNRYTKGAEGSIHLSNYSGVSIIVDRKNDNPVYIKTPHISIMGAIQPGMLPELGKDNRDSNGMIDRFLFAFPVKADKQYWNDEEMPDSVMAEWDNILNKVIDLKYQQDAYGNFISTELRYSQEAYRKLLDWQRANTDLCNQAPDKIASVYSKLEIAISRLSLILQIFKWACGEESKDGISVETVDNAITLTEYFRKTAIRVHSILNEPPSEKLPELQKTVFNALPDLFKTSEGLAVAAKYNFPERTFMEFLKDKSIFKKIKHGEYEKLK